jgi:hypothetical protein
MAIKKKTAWLTEEIANFFASCPSRDQLLNYRPPEDVQRRAQELVHKLKANQLTSDEQWELDQFEHAESLLQMIKARIRRDKVVHA